ncbi:hypothetical protein STEG23_018772, partial [Scotinomys teguina]
KFSLETAAATIAKWLEEIGFQIEENVIKCNTNWMNWEEKVPSVKGFHFEKEEFEDHSHVMKITRIPHCIPEVNWLDDLSVTFTLHEEDHQMDDFCVTLTLYEEDNQMDDFSVTLTLHEEDNQMDDFSVTLTLYEEDNQMDDFSVTLTLYAEDNLRMKTLN